MTLLWSATSKRAIGLALAGLMLFVASGFVPALAQAATEEEDALRLAQLIGRSLTAIEDGERDGPRDRWDPQYVVDTVGIEPADLYSWVRVNVGWVPYEGALRGPAGVLMDRLGNSLDQSLLLAELLTLSGHDVRLAHAQLSAEQAQTLWDAMVAARDAATAAALAQSAAAQDEVSAEAPVLPAAETTEAPV
jgi:hypothetical protein